VPSTPAEASEPTPTTPSLRGGLPPDHATTDLQTADEDAVASQRDGWHSPSTPTRITITGRQRRDIDSGPLTRAILMIVSEMGTSREAEND
jgi:hypothetical protein